MDIGPLASREIVKVEASRSLAETARLMKERNVGSAVVATEDGRPGIITERDFLRAIAEGVDPDAATVEDFMTPSAITSTASWDVFEAAHRMMDGGFRHLIVLDDTGEVEGMVSIRDLFRYLLDQASSRT